MNNYFQPDFYHFSQDSIDLSKFAADLIGKTGPLNVIDYGAGCGVVSLEFAQLCQVKKITFVELQPEFTSYIEKNITQFPVSAFHIFCGKISHYQPGEKVDVIFSNPPYFDPSKNRISPDKNKALCRSFIVDSLEILFEQASKHLIPGGYFFLSYNQNEKYFENLVCLNYLQLIQIEKKNNYWLFCFKRL